LGVATAPTRSSPDDDDEDDGEMRISVGEVLLEGSVVSVLAAIDVAVAEVVVCDDDANGYREERSPFELE
jgi:hypothetical protein